MNERNTTNKNHSRTSWPGRAGRIVALLGCVYGLAQSAVLAQTYNGPTTTVPAGQAAPYSWPGYHAGGAPNLNNLSAGYGPYSGTQPAAGTATVPYPLPPYDMLQGTPSGAVQTSAAGVTPPVYQYTQIFSDILGNWNAGEPPTGLTGNAGAYNLAFFPNHFENGPDFTNHYFQIEGPLAYLPGNAPSAKAPGEPTADVQGSPAAINYTEYNEIADMYYVGEQVAGGTTVNPTIGVSGAPGIGHGTPPGTTTPVTAGDNAIRQVVYFTRYETVPCIANPKSPTGYSLGGVPVPVLTVGTVTQPVVSVGTEANVGAVYAMDGFTGGIIWRYQLPGFYTTQVASTTQDLMTATLGNATLQTVTNALGAPEPFQIGPDGPDEGTAALAGNPGTFTVNAMTPALNPAFPATLNYSLYATSAVANPDGTATYSGTFLLYTGATPTATTIDAQGGFSFTTVNAVTTATGYDGPVTGTFYATSGSFNGYQLSPYTPLAYTGTLVVNTYNASGADTTGTLSGLTGNLTTEPSGQALRVGAPIYSSCAVARMNVTESNGTVANKLVVIAADNNGYVYCLDAVGNGPRDNAAESNTNVVYQDTSNGGYNYTTNANTVGQVDYDNQANELSNGAGYVQDVQPHIGTTFPYWIYRPDPTQPLQGPGAKNPGEIDTAPGSDHTLPTPQAFGTASPTVLVNPTNNDGTVLIGNSNGVLYALDGTGGVVADVANEGPKLANAYNLSIALSAAQLTTYAGVTDISALPGIPDDTPTTNIDWWDALSGETADTSSEAVEIESAPSVYTPTGAVYPTPPAGSSSPTTANASDVEVYVGTSDPNGTSAGRVYAVDAATGPVGDGGLGTDVPGSGNYNNQPTGLWAFPKIGEPSLGDISGSPAVFYNPNDTAGPEPKIYFGADTGEELSGSNTNPASRDTGRVWSINTTGTFNWAYPTCTDPNAGEVTATEPSIEGFRLATPAIGMVQFPAVTQYISAAGALTTYTHPDAVDTTSIAGKYVPMLYIGSDNNTTGNLYALDLDASTTGTPAANDAERGVYAYNGDQGNPFFVGSPALVTNPSTAGGNGGSVFITANNELLQYQATPISTASSSAPYASPRLDYIFPYGGATSSPALAAANVADINNTVPATGSGYTDETVTDWVYVGDSTTGQCFGFTPQGFGNDQTGGYLNNIIPTTPAAYNAPPIVSQFPIRAFVVDNSTTAAQTPNMNNTDPYGKPTSPLPAFEWGNTIGFRLANVVPPGPPATADNNYVLDPTSSPANPIYFGNGSAITFQTTEVDNSGNDIPGTVDSFTIPAQVITYPGVTSTNNPSNTNGFIERTDYGTLYSNFGNSSELNSTTTAEPTSAANAANDYWAPTTELLDPNGLGWVACGAYSIGFDSPLDPDGANRHNTPGASRRIISATQTVTRYTMDGTTFVPISPDPTFQINLTANPAFTYDDAASTATAATDETPNQGTLYIDQPTFGIMNPLAVRGAGINLTAPLSTTNPEVAPTWLDANGQEGIGPFRGIAASSLTPGTNDPTDMEALANGNMIDTTPPPSGVLALTPNPTTPSQNTITSIQQLAPVYRYVITTTGQVLDGTTGENTNLLYPTQVPAQGVRTSGGNNDSGIAAGVGYGANLLDIGDRSQLGLVAPSQTVNGTVPYLTVNIQQRPLNWQDNTGAGGPGSVINPLPWETDLPEVGANTSVDYPDIPRADLSYGIVGNSALPGATLPNASTTDVQRFINPESVPVNIAVPKYQPANLQLWNQNPSAPATYGGITPNVAGTGTPNYHPLYNNFPMGYSALVKVAASSSGSVNPNDPNAAYRYVYVYTGVPVDINTSITNSVTDVGVEPAGFGEQMAGFPINPLTGQYEQGGSVLGALAFTPYSTYPVTTPATPYLGFEGYNGHFQPLSITSNSNVNLVNPHLDQVLNDVTANGSALTTLPLLSDSLDSSTLDQNSFIPAYDFNGISGTSGSFLVRSSLDSDLQQYEANKGETGTQLNPYPGVTFHKPLVGDTTGTTMTVPDLPHGDTGTYYYPESAGSAPALNSSGLPAYATLPYVGVEVPYGTAVGTYSQNLRLFEGYDISTYPLKSLLPPTYNRIPANAATATAPLAPNQTDDAFGLEETATGVQGLQPYSDPATQLKVTVEENQLTNGFSIGALPMFDTGLAGISGASATNFAPFAYRDPASGDLNMYWTSSRDYTAGTPPEYNTFGEHLNFISAATSGANDYFAPASPTQWWAPITGFPFSATTPPSNNIDWSVAPTQTILSSGDGYGPDAGATTAYGFGINLDASSPYTSSIGCFALNSTSGAPTGAPVSVASSTQPLSDLTGLSFTGVSFANPNAGSGGASTLSENLWAFWTQGTRGNTALYYSNTNAGGGQPGPFSPPSALPVPAGIVAVSHPSAVLTQAPIPGNSTGTDMPVIEVTYSGVGPTGATNLYLSRYQPYQPTATSPVLLGLVPMPAVQEQLSPAPGSNWWQGRDVGWARNNYLQFSVAVTDNGTTDTNIITETGPSTFSETINGTAVPLLNPQITYDRAGGLLVFTNVTLPLANGTALTQEAGQSVFVDPAGGRIRFSVNLPVASPNIQAQKSPAGAFSSVQVTASPTARRITTSQSTDTGPVAFLDQSYEPNESGVASDPNVQADRYWFLWHRIGAGSNNPAIWYKTQRLTVALTDAVTGLPAAIPLTTGANAGEPDITVKLGGTTLYAPGGGSANIVDIDATRGRLYFPIVYDNTAMEGQKVTISGNDTNGNAFSSTDLIEWMDEPQYNDVGSQTPSGAVQALTADGYEIPMNTVVNESGISAFLDPLSYSLNSSSSANNYPHKIWLFWTSTRNGTSDIYNETINPRFSAVSNSGIP